ncbi:MAG: ATP-binding cassette domain-containing protein [Cytophagaceae bacterium]|jgi:ABC-type lipoprotein export system ATPase subunit|nr:ATP-binding cassette domain-containing protein [Cytophagaceae bacterium]
MIKLLNIQKSYQDGENRLNRVLCGVNMKIDKGEFVAVKGASGAGKTTLLSILGTLLLPDEGSYLLNNVELTAPNTDRSLIRNKQIGFVFQDHRLLPQYSALENILLPTLAYSSQTSAEHIEYARMLMKLTHISRIANQYPHTLSGGEASRVAVCRALIMKPLLLLADEPTGQLDAENARNIALLLSDINKNLQTTIVMVTHSDEISQSASRMLTLNEGGLV